MSSGRVSVSERLQPQHRFLGPFQCPTFHRRMNEASKAWNDLVSFGPSCLKKSEQKHAYLNGGVILPETFVSQ